MKRLALALTVLAFATPALAQDPISQPSPSDLQVQQDPQLYMLMKMMERYDNPKQAVHRKAEVKAAQRRGRLASQKWYGFSPLRPNASPLPWMGTSAQHWVGNGVNPHHWVGHDFPTASPRVETITR